MELECLFIFNSLKPNEEFVKLLKFKICSSLKSGGDILFSKLKSKIDDRKFGVILILYFASLIIDNFGLFFDIILLNLMLFVSFCFFLR
jgi:hypothetical protein